MELLTESILFTAHVSIGLEFMPKLVGSMATGREAWNENSKRYHILVHKHEAENQLGKSLIYEISKSVPSDILPTRPHILILLNFINWT